MSAFKWMRDLIKDRRGNVLLVGAAAMPILIGAAGLAVDTTQLVLWKRQLQRTADSGAIAGAYALSQGASRGAAVANDIDEHIDYDLQQNEHPVLTGVDVDTGSYAAGSISTDTCATRAISPCFGRAVRVALTTQRTLPFLGIFTREPTIVRADAAAALVDEGEYCVVSLYNGTATGISTNGTASVNLGCGMATNSRGNAAVTAGGSSSITATPIAAVGNIDGVNNNFDGDTTLLPYSSEQSDPFASLPEPPAQTCNNNLNVNPNETTTISQGCYRSLTIKGNVTLQPGVYYINGGDIDISSQAVVKGTGVTIVMTGPNGAAGDLKINGGATIDLTASESGDYKNILFFRDRRASNIELKINGNSSSRMRGALYFPSSDISYEGTTGMSIECVQMVGQIVTFRGNANITNSCPSGGPKPFKNTVVRLIG